ncbi:MAG: hypothetical protein KDD60_05630, partial [Bdellovibrionales bacterium]|nr:hypothetical protein [Bdellovibrionales bacterium]
EGKHILPAENSQKRPVFDNSDRTFSFAGSIKTLFGVSAPKYLNRMFFLPILGLSGLKLA